MKYLWSSIVENLRIRLNLLALFALTLSLIGFVTLILSIIDFFHGRFSIIGEDDIKLESTFEYVFWSSTGKAFCLGLVLITTGLIGILSSREATRTSMFVFTYLSILSSILSLFMTMTCIVTIRFHDKYKSDNRRSKLLSNDFVFNALLIIVAVLGFVVSLVTSIVGALFAACFRHERQTSSYNLNSSGTSTERNPALNCQKLSSRVSMLV